MQNYTLSDMDFLINNIKKITGTLKNDINRQNYINTLINFGYSHQTLSSKDLDLFAKINKLKNKSGIYVFHKMPGSNILTFKQWKQHVKNHSVQKK